MPRTLVGWLHAVLTAIVVASCGSPGSRERREPPVQLIVLISVDQLPTYLLQRYDSLYSGGLRRLLDQGRRYEQAVHDHAFTVTAAGHATLATGAVPARHGVVANEWYERADGEWERVRSVYDTDERIPDLPHVTGRSPRRLQTTGLADWIVALDAGARIVSLSGKDRAAILMASEARGHVYWYEDDVGRFVTSTYYRDDYPEWVDRYHSEVLPDFYTDSIWELTVPSDARPLARRDAAEYEYDGAHITFPHRFIDQVADEEASEPQEYYDWWDHTPELDRATVALAEAAVTALSLGQRGSVDFLALGLSQLDRVGHRFGPLSLEQLDAILRLDRALGEFFEFLDDNVGEGHYLVGLSSDHGVLPIPEYRAELGQPGRRIGPEERRAAYRVAGDAAASNSPAEAQAAMVEALEAIDFIADVMTLEELSGGGASDSFIAIYQRSVFPGRVPGSLGQQGLVVRMIEGAHASADATTHGTPYLYDRHVPLILMGPGVMAGTSEEQVRTVDMAPTLAALAGIPYPSDLDGRPLIKPTP